MAIVDGAGVALHYEETSPPAGGPAAVVVHGMASDAAAHTATRDGLAAAGFRAVAYDRRGYGASTAPEHYVGTTVQEQAQDLLALLDGLDAAPAVLVGDGFGALVALDVALRAPAQVRAAVLVDPPLYALVPEATETLRFERLALDAAVRERGPRGAVDVWAGDRGDGAVVARAQETPQAFLADYAGLASLPVTRAALRALATPVAVVTGPDTPDLVTLAADRIAALVPGAVRTADGDAVGAAART